MKMIKEYFFWILVGVAVLVFIGFALANSNNSATDKNADNKIVVNNVNNSGNGGAVATQTTPDRPASSELEKFAACLSEKGAAFYGASWCSFCNMQKEQFADASDFLPYVECALTGSQGQTPACQQANIEAYPTWVFADGSREMGVLSFEQLAGKTGCAVPQS